MWLKLDPEILIRISDVCVNTNVTFAKSVLPNTSNVAYTIFKLRSLGVTSKERCSLLVSLLPLTGCSLSRFCFVILICCLRSLFGVESILWYRTLFIPPCSIGNACLYLELADDVWMSNCMSWYFVTAFM